MFAEAYRSIGDDELPTHLFVQCGVGTLAAGAASFVVEQMKRQTSERPILVMVEPTSADAFSFAVSFGAGSPLESPHASNSVMGGLNCNQISPDAFPLLCSTF